MVDLKEIVSAFECDAWDNCGGDQSAFFYDPAAILERPTGRTRSYNNDISTCESFCKAVIDSYVAIDDLVAYCSINGFLFTRRGCASYLLDWNMREIDGYPGRFATIVERQLVDVRT